MAVKNLAEFACVNHKHTAVTGNYLFRCSDVFTLAHTLQDHRLDFMNAQFLNACVKLQTRH